MSSVVSKVTDAVGLTDTKGAGDASLQASKTQAKYQQQALDYLKEREALPQQFREGALAQLGGLYGLEGGEGGQQALIDQARSSPLYGAILGGQDAAEEAVLRNASATGGLRSGNVQSALADQAQQLHNQALLESYNQQLSGLQGLAALPSNAGAIAAQTSGIGQTLGQGQVAQQQAIVGAQNQLFSDVVDIGSAAAGGFSDIRLKDDIKLIDSRNGWNWYSWVWNRKASELGLLGEDEGVMAHEVYDVMPEAVSEQDGYMKVDYSMIGALADE